VIERCRSWLEHKTHSGNLAGRTNYEGANPQRIECDEQASERLRKHAIDISLRRKYEDPIEAAIWSRHAEKTNKLALLFACSRWTEGAAWPTINLADADRAISLNNYLTRRMLKQAGVYVSESIFETVQLKVMRVIMRREEWTQSELDAGYTIPQTARANRGSPDAGRVRRNRGRGPRNGRATCPDLSSQTHNHEFGR
jgi:hypothetical protein